MELDVELLHQTNSLLYFSCSYSPDDRDGRDKQTRVFMQYQQNSTKNLITRWSMGREGDHDTKHCFTFHAHFNPSDRDGKNTEVKVLVLLEQNAVLNTQ